MSILIKNTYLLTVQLNGKTSTLSRQAVNFFFDSRLFHSQAEPFTANRFVYVPYMTMPPLHNTGPSDMFLSWKSQAVVDQGVVSTRC